MTTLFDDSLVRPDASTLMANPGAGIGVADNAGMQQGAGLEAPQGLGLSVPDQGQGAPEPQAAAPAAQPAAESVSPFRRAMFNLAAGANGTPRYDEAQANLSHQKLTTLVDGMKALSSIPSGKEREEVAAKMAPHMGDMGDAFLSLAKQPDYSQKLLDHAHDSPTLARSLQTIGPAATIHLMGTEAFNKTVNAEIDAKRLPVVQAHVKTLLTAAPMLDPEIAADIKKRGYATHGDITALNDLAAKALPAAAMKPTDLAILNQHAEGVYAGVAGTLGPAGAKQALLNSIEKNQPTGFMREAEALHGKDTPAYFDAIQKHVDRMDRPAVTNVGADGNPTKGWKLGHDQAGDVYRVNENAGKAEKQQADGSWVSSPIPSGFTTAATQGAGGRESVFTGRVLSAANGAVKAIKNIMELPVASSMGVFGGTHQGPGLLDATKTVLANKMTSQDVQSYKSMMAGVSRNLSAIETSGLVPTGALTHQLGEATELKEGDTNITKLRKLAEVRQIVEAGLEPLLVNPRVTAEQKDFIKGINKQFADAVPFTHSDITKLEKGGAKVTLRQFATKSGLIKPAAETPAPPDGFKPL